YDERPDHFGVDEVAKLLQLTKPVVKAVCVRIATQIADVFHVYERRIELFVEERMSVRRIERQRTAGARLSTIHHFENHASPLRGVGGFSNQRVAVGGREWYARSLRQLVDKLRRIQSAVCCLKVRPV